MKTTYITLMIIGIIFLFTGLIFITFNYGWLLTACLILIGIGINLFSAGIKARMTAELKAKNDENNS
jgi:predicted membrane protein